MAAPENTSSATRAEHAIPLSLIGVSNERTTKHAATEKLPSSVRILRRH